jgi:hypothetical protein
MVAQGELKGKKKEDEEEEWAMNSEDEKTVELKQAPTGGDLPKIEEEKEVPVKEVAKVVEETEEDKAKKEEELKVKI